MGLVHYFRSRDRLAIAIFLAVGLSPQSPATEIDASGLGQFDPTRLQWRTLVFESPGLFSSVDARVELRQIAATDGLWVPMPHASEPLQRPEGKSVLVLDARVDSRAGVLSKVRQESVWFDAGNGRVFQQLRYEGGDEPSQKYYRFGDNGAFRLQRRPANSAELDRIANWSDIEESTYLEDTRSEGCKLIVESTTLFYIVSVVDTDLHPPPWTFCVFSRKHLYPVKITALGTKTLSVDYHERVREESRRQRGKRVAQVLELALSEDSDGSASADSFYLLGMRLPIRLYLDIESRVPIRISGRVPKFGRGELELREVQPEDRRD